MSVETNLDALQENYKQSTNKAKELLKDKEKAKETIDKAFSKATKDKSKLEEVWNYLMLFFSITRDYLNGKYKEVPLGTIIAIIGALIYFLSPIDLIPDFIPVVGYIDDIFVIGLVINQVSSDLKKYEEWKATQD